MVSYILDYVDSDECSGNGEQVTRLGVTELGRYEGIWPREPTTCQEEVSMILRLQIHCIKTQMVLRQEATYLYTNKDRHSVYWTFNLHFLPSLTSTLLPPQLPRRPPREISSRLALSRFKDRHNKILRAIQVLRLNVPGLLVLRELIEQGADDRRALLVGLLHQTPRVVAKLLTDGNVLLADLVDFLPIGPDLVVASRGRRLVRRFGLPVPVEAHNRAERPPLEPPCEKLPERWVVGVAAVESPDVCRPPWDAGQAHVQASG